MGTIVIYGTSIRSTTLSHPWILIGPNIIATFTLLDIKYLHTTTVPIIKRLRLSGEEQEKKPADLLHPSYNLYCYELMLTSHHRTILMEHGLFGGLPMASPPFMRPPRRPY